MPYIKQERRALVEIDLQIETAGDINYSISKALWDYFDLQPSYSRINEIIGVLECIKLEFYRRKASVYEDVKIKENGDL